MISDELKQIIVQIEEQGKVRFIEAATEEQISQFEKENQIQFPSKYKEWLLFSDGGEIFLPAGVQLFGVRHKPLIDLENNDRPDDNYIVIGALASGEPVLCKKDEKKSMFMITKIKREMRIWFIMTFLIDLYDLLGIGE